MGHGPSTVIKAYDQQVKNSTGCDKGEPDDF
jgi:hypothetical protein